MKTKDKVLDILKEIQGEYISGEEIAEKTKVTRAAIWKAIRTLKAQGYNIDAVTNKGYRLRYVPDLINKEEIEKQLLDSNIELNVFHFDEVSSTNDVALEFMKEKKNSTLVIAESQTSGRGRRGRDFYSPKNTGLYMSLSFCTNKSLECYKNITAMAASATALAIDDVVFDSVDTTKIKWVNDIFLNGLKVAGILTECYSVLEDDNNYITIGIGINVCTPEKDFPKDIKNIAGAIFTKGQIKEGDVRNRLCVSIIKYLYSFMQNEIDMKCIDTYKKKSMLIGSYVKINNFTGSYDYAYVTGISDEYKLLIKYDDGRSGELISGEVSVVKY